MAKLKFNFAGIYKIINKVTKKIYVGSALNIQVRWGQYIVLLKSGKHPNKYLQAAFNKVGGKNFKFIVIERIKNLSILIKREQYWINKYRSYVLKMGYNLRQKTESQLGFKHSDETKHKMSIAKKGVIPWNKGTKMSLKTKEKCRISHLGQVPWNKGLPMAEAQRKFLSSLRKGIKHTEEHKEKIGLSNLGKNKGKKHTETTKKQMRLSHLDVKLSKEHIKNISSSLQNFWKNKRCKRMS